VRAVYLEVRASNIGGQDFYRRMGFQEIGRRRSYYDKPREDALVLTREITPKIGLRKSGWDRVSLVDKRT